MPITLHTLVDEVTTPWGIYRAGLRVRVIARGDTTITVDLSPRGMPPRPWEIPADPRTWPANAHHGTPRGYQIHRQLNETPCRTCSQAMRDYQHRYKIRTGRTTVRIQPEVLADLYVHAAIPAQIRAEQAMGEGVLSAAVYRHDELNSAYDGQLSAH